MKKYILILILISNIIFIKNDEDVNYGSPGNINIESISYELTYNNYSVVKVTIKTYDELETDISFIAYLKSHVEQKTFKLNCSMTFYDIIECYSEKNASFNVNDKFFFYYNKTNPKITFDERDILEDDKQISLIFKPDISVDDKLYRDNRKITAEIDGKMVGGGYLYITKKSKHVLNKPRDGFNKNIELKNFIAQVGLQNSLLPGTLIGYKEAIKRGFHIVDAVLRFSADKVPVICREDDLENVSDGNGKISKTKIRDLLKLDFGSKFGKKYQNEKILTLEILLQLCKELNVIIDLDLSQLNSEYYFGSNLNYINILLNLIVKYDMFNSIYFSDGENSTNILKLLSVKKDIAISVSNINKKEDLDKLRTQFPGAKIIIINPSLNNLDEKFVLYAKLLGYKIKVNSVNDISYAKKIANWGVDYIAETLNFEPFLLENSKEDPILVRCIPMDDDHSECEIDDDVYLKDNEYYNIYYSENIYNLSSDINSEPIAEFQYVETNILDELYYMVIKFDFNEGILLLNLSEALKTGEEIFGVVAPDYDDVAEIYQFNFVCTGKGNFAVDCKIKKDDENKLEFKGKYSIYYLEDYSFNEYETEERTNNHEDDNIVEYVIEEKFPYLLTFCIIIFIIIVIVLIYCLKFRKRDSNNDDRVRIADNNYLSDNYLFR